MFTGIIQAVGSMAAMELRAGDMRLQVATRDLDLADVEVGDSIAVAGCCLTVVTLAEQCFASDVSKESLRLTTLGSLQVGAALNLEKALRLSDRLGGHLVSGHVDGTGSVVAIKAEARSSCFTFAAPSALARYIAAKGSICIDGVSLTVNHVDGERFSVNLIPHTLQHTTFAHRQVGDMVNLEIDLMARYAERLFNVPA